MKTMDAFEIRQSPAPRTEFIDLPRDKAAGSIRGTAGGKQSFKYDGEFYNFS
jgi:hypothetical protein